MAWGDVGRKFSTSIGSFFGGGGAEQAGQLARLQQLSAQQQLQLGALKLRAAQQEAALKTPETTIGRTMLSLGVPQDAQPDVQQWLKTGGVQRFDDFNTAVGRGELPGPVLPPPTWYTPETGARLRQGYAGAQAVQSGDAKSLGDYYKAQGEAQLTTEIGKAMASGDMVRVAQLQNKDPLKQVESIVAAGIGGGSVPPQLGGQRMAAIGGKPLYSTNGAGAVLDMFGGGLDTSNPLATATVGLRDQQAGQARAGAVKDYAQAGNANASAAKTRAELDGITRGDGRVPSGYRANGSGGLEPIPGGPADPATKGARSAKPPTEGQSKALMFATRMQAADETLGELAAAGTERPSLLKQAVGDGKIGVFANAMQDPAQQQVEQAQRDFVNAVLRKESGAAISQGEFDNARRQYFPQPGDSTAVKQQKSINRQTAIAGMKTEFGEQFAPDFDQIVTQARSARSAPSGAAAAGSATVQVKTDADYHALPPGTRFVTPDGKTGTKR